MGAATLIAKYKAQLEGMFGAEFGTNPNNPKFKHIVDTYKAKYNTDVPYPSYAQTEYDAVYMLKDAITQVGYDGTKIATWGHNVNNWQGAAGSVTIGANGDLVGGSGVEIVKDGKVGPYTK
jgi:ABC-type branched-subunit amino acid transport system substrate-binding protein